MKARFWHALSHTFTQATAADSHPSRTSRERKSSGASCSGSVYGSGVAVRGRAEGAFVRSFACYSRVHNEPRRDDSMSRECTITARWAFAIEPALIRAQELTAELGLLQRRIMSHLLILYIHNPDEQSLLLPLCLGCYALQSFSLGCNFHTCRYDNSLHLFWSTKFFMLRVLSIFFFAIVQV